jgi:hypothetical protein
VQALPAADLPPTILNTGTHLESGRELPGATQEKGGSKSNLFNKNMLISASKTSFEAIPINA